MGNTAEFKGLTPKQAWWAGVRVGLGLDADTPRQIVAQRLSDVKAKASSLTPVDAVSVDHEIHTAAQSLIDLAARRGMNVTISKASRKPLAMGHTDTVVEVWQKKHVPTAVGFNGLTDAETDSTASVAGLVKAGPGNKE